MQTLTEAVIRLAPPGGVFNDTVVRNLFPDASDGARKLLVHRAVARQEVIRLTRGLFLLCREYRRTDPHPYVLAALLHSPSHVSLESALAHHGLIPEAVRQVSCVTALRSRSFSTPVGVFSYYRVPARLPRAGVEAVKLGAQSWAFVATPLRALADMIYLNRDVSWGNDGMAYLLESLRIEEEDLVGLSFDALPRICEGIRNRRVTEYLEQLAEEVGRAR